MAHTKKATPAYFVKAVCCGAVMLIFIIVVQKNFSFLPRGEAEEKSFFIFPIYFLLSGKVLFHSF